MGEGTRPHNLNIIIIYIVAILASKEVFSCAESRRNGL